MFKNLLMACMVIAFTLVAAPAIADPPPAPHSAPLPQHQEADPGHTSPTVEVPDVSEPPSNCVRKGDVGGFAHAGQSVDLSALFTGNTFAIKVCYVKKMRVFKAIANTDPERKELRVFAKEIKSDYPVLYCESGERGVLVDLAYFWQAKMKSLNTSERNGYRSWARGYAQRNGCKAYL